MRVDFNRSFFHSVALADGDARAKPERTVHVIAPGRAFLRRLVKTMRLQYHAKKGE